MSNDARDWDDLAKADPYWAILTWPDRRDNRWDQADFLRTGESELATVLLHVGELGVRPRLGRALDVGCGVGRVTLALSTRFGVSQGVDVSRSMLEIARELARDRPNCVYSLIASDGRLPFDDRTFDFVYCSRVLQHLANRASIERLIRELIRVTAPKGIVVFQLPTRIPLRHRVQARRRIYRLLRRTRVSHMTLIQEFRLTPMAMRAVDEQRIRSVVTAAGGEVLSVIVDEPPGGIAEATYYATR